MKEKLKYNFGKSALLGLIILSFIFVIAGCGSSTAEPKKTTETPENYLKSAIESEIGSQAIIANSPRVRKITNEKGNLTADLNADISTKNTDTRISMLLNTEKVFEKVFKDKKGVTFLTINWHVELTADNRGNTKDSQVMSATMTQQNASTIKWDNFSYDAIPKVADKYTEDPGLNINQ